MSGRRYADVSRNIMVVGYTREGSGFSLTPLAGSRFWLATAAAVVAAPLVLLALLLARPALDATWENQQAHF